MVAVEGMGSRVGGDGELFLMVGVEGRAGEGRGWRGMCGGQQSWGKRCVCVWGGGSLKNRSSS